MQISSQGHYDLLVPNLRSAIAQIELAFEHHHTVSGVSKEKTRKLYKIPHQNK